MTNFPVKSISLTQCMTKRKICTFSLGTTCHINCSQLSHKISPKLCFKNWQEFFNHEEKSIPSRAYSSSLMCAIIARNHLPFFKIFSNFVHFCPNFQYFALFKHFFAIFCPFSEKSHACPYFLE